MDKVVGTVDPITGKVTDMNGNEVSGTITVNGVELSKAIVADAIWQGVKHMEDEAYRPDANSDRKRHLLSRMKKALAFHYALLGCSKEEAEECAEGYIHGTVLYHETH